MPTDSAHRAASDGDHREVASAFAERVHEELGESVAGLYLFGSVAADAHHHESDVDLLAVVADEAEYATVDDRLLDIAYDVLVAHGVPVEVHTIREAEFEAREARGEPLVRRVITEGERV